MAALNLLIPTSFRGVAFPSTTVKSQGGHNIVEHKRVDRDGALYENTGRKSGVFELSIPMVNGQTPGPAETWPATLYPDQYELLIRALEDRSPGVLSHPAYGDRLVVVQSWTTEVSADQRGGEIIQVQFSETLDINGDLPSSVSPETQTGVADTAARELVAIYPPAEAIAAESGGLTAWVQSLGKIKGKIAIATNSGIGRIERVIYRLDSLVDLPDLPAEARVKTYRLMSALRQVVAQDSGNHSRSVSTYFTPGTCTISQVAQRVKNTSAEIMELNPQLRFGVPAEYRVRYYAS